jgi:hypothetical protein
VAKIVQLFASPFELKNDGEFLALTDDGQIWERHFVEEEDEFVWLAIPTPAVEK